MASHYDPKKKCRVGTMDEDQFYSEANEKTRIQTPGLLLTLDQWIPALKARPPVDEQGEEIRRASIAVGHDADGVER